MTPSAEKYKAQSAHYLANAFGAMEAGDAEKAGEFLWGSMAEALKAVAASKGIQLNRHWDIGDYARKLAKELGDASISDVHGIASSLHTNFYEAGLRMEEVYTYAERIRTVVEKLLRLISEGVRDQGG